MRPLPREYLLFRPIFVPKRSVFRRCGGARMLLTVAQSRIKGSTGEALFCRDSRLCHGGGLREIDPSCGFVEFSRRPSFTLIPTTQVLNLLSLTPFSSSTPQGRMNMPLRTTGCLSMPGREKDGIVPTQPPRMKTPTIFTLPGEHFPPGLESVVSSGPLHLNLV